MLAIGAKIHQKMMDNAGGHGTRKARDEDTTEIKGDHNIITKFQLLCSPCPNALDLEIRMSLQLVIKKRQWNGR
jgi:hypothetical protein